MYGLIIHSKRYCDECLHRDIERLRASPSSFTCLSHAGNKFLYHHQLGNLLHTRIPHKKTLEEVMNDEEAYDRLVRFTLRLDRKGSWPSRVFEAWRFNHQIGFFSPMLAKACYEHYGATHVLDPTAGWGGRMLGAHALGISYTGIDTNTAMKGAYDQMMKRLDDPRLSMIWSHALDVALESIPYDHVLTCPPYVDAKGHLVETYENMPAIDDFYDFLVPLLQRCLQHIRKGGVVCFFMTEVMYDEVAARFRPADESPPVRTKHNALRKRNHQGLYVWRA